MAKEEKSSRPIPPPPPRLPPRIQRGGTPRLKFTPKIPQRDTSLAPPSLPVEERRTEIAPGQSHPREHSRSGRGGDWDRERGRDRSRGGGDGRSRGRGRDWDRGGTMKNREKESQQGSRDESNETPAKPQIYNPLEMEIDDISHQTSSEIDFTSNEFEKKAEKEKKNKLREAKAKEFAANQSAPTILPWTNPFQNEVPQLPDNDAHQLFMDETGSFVPSRLFLVQVPKVFPYISPNTQPATTSSTSAPLGKDHNKGASLMDLPDGHIGKILVYKSGKVKMNLNGILYDLRPGTKCSFSQQAALISAENKTFTVLGDVNTTMLMIPDYENMLIS
jgi:hypothetical protein